MPAFTRSPLAALALTMCLAGAACSATASSPNPSPGPSGGSTSAPASVPPSPTPRVTAPPATLAPGVLRMLDIQPRPSGITTAGTLIWAEDHAATNSVYAIDPNTGEIVAAIDLGRPCDVILLDDRIWVADVEAGKLVWIDQGTLAIGGEIAGLRRPCGILPIAGNIWLAVDDGLARVDPGTGEVAITALADGAAFPGPGVPVWASMADTGDLVRVDPSSGEVTLTVPHPAGGWQGPPPAVGFDSVWVGALERVYRLDPESGRVDAEIQTSTPTRFLATATGIWFTSYSLGTIERIDPATNAVVFRASLGGNINGIAEGLGGIWVSDTGNGRLYLIDANATGIAR